MFKVISDFKDLRDGGYQYKKGDTYPREGKADPERVKVLSTPTTMRLALIELADDEPKKPAKPVKKKAED